MASAPVMLRPISFGEILDGTFTLYRRYFWLFIGIAALPNAVLFAVQLIPDLLPSAARSDQERAAVLALWVPLVIFVYVPLSFFSIGANCHAVSEIYLGRMTGVASAYRAVKPAFWSLVGTALLVGVAVALAGGMVLLIGVMLIATKSVPAILVGFLLFLLAIGIALFLFLRFSLVSPVVVLEQDSGLDAMRRSASLLQKNLLRTAGLYVVFGLISIVVGTVFQMPFFILLAVKAARQAPAAMSPGLAALYNLARAISSTLVAPLFYIGVTLLYYDIRVRKEAFDLQMMAASIRRPSPAPGATTP